MLRAQYVLPHRGTVPGVSSGPIESLPRPTWKVDGMGTLPWWVAMTCL
ncbi:MAG TPA: hypothetical protein VFZ09_33835 [Archangium sp.]|nr:hypothetical protein [Archangium sp.]HEX5751254.1 hypothetical protein [Archangium sp.]